MEEAIKLKTKDVPANLRQGYKGRKFQMIICRSVKLPSGTLWWDGGTRDKFKAVHLETGDEIAFGSDAAPWAFNQKDKELEIKPGFVVVKHSFFMGKDMGLTFYVNGTNVARFLPRIRLKEDF